MLPGRQSTNPSIRFQTPSRAPSFSPLCPVRTFPPARSRKVPQGYASQNTNTLPRLRTLHCYPEKFCFFDNILPGMCCKFLQSQALRTAHFPMTLFPSFPLLPSVTSFGCGFAALCSLRFISPRSPYPTPSDSKIYFIFSSAIAGKDHARPPATLENQKRSCAAAIGPV